MPKLSGKFRDHPYWILVEVNNKFMVSSWFDSERQAEVEFSWLTQHHKFKNYKLVHIPSDVDLLNDKIPF